MGTRNPSLLSRLADKIEPTDAERKAAGLTIKEKPRRFRFWERPTPEQIAKAEAQHPGRGPKPVGLFEPLGQLMAWFTDGSVRHVGAQRPHGKSQLRLWKKARRLAREAEARRAAKAPTYQATYQATSEGGQR